MELLEPQRTVIFEGMQLVIPFDTHSLTIDDDGAIVAHGECPWPEVGFWESNNELGIVGYVSEIDGQQWKMQNDPFFVGDKQLVIGNKFTIRTGIPGGFDDMAKFHDEGPLPSLGEKRISTFNPVLVVADNQVKTD